MRKWQFKEVQVTEPGISKFSSNPCPSEFNHLPLMIQQPDTLEMPFFITIQYDGAVYNGVICIPEMRLSHASFHKMLVSSLFLLTILPSFISLSPWYLLSSMPSLNPLPFPQTFLPLSLSALARNIQQYQKIKNKKQQLLKCD